MIQVKTFYLNDLRECCHIVYDETGECVIIDPGCQTPVPTSNTLSHFFIPSKWVCSATVEGCEIVCRAAMGSGRS